MTHKINRSHSPFPHFFVVQAIAFLLLLTTMQGQLDAQVPNSGSRGSEKQANSAGYAIVEYRFIYRDSLGNILLDLPCNVTTRTVVKNGNETIETTETAALFSEDRSYAAYFRTTHEQHRLLESNFSYYGPGAKLLFTKEGITSHPGLTNISKDGAHVALATEIPEIPYWGRENEMPPNDVYLFDKSGRILYQSQASAFTIGPRIWPGKFISFYAYDYFGPNRDIIKYLKIVDIDRGSETRHDYGEFPNVMEISLEGSYTLREGDWLNHYDTTGQLIERKRVEK